MVCALDTADCKAMWPKLCFTVFCLSGNHLWEICTTRSLHRERHQGWKALPAVEPGQLLAVALFWTTSRIPFRGEGWKIGCPLGEIRTHSAAWFCCFRFAQKLGIWTFWKPWGDSPQICFMAVLRPSVVPVLFDALLRWGMGWALPESWRTLQNKNVSTSPYGPYVFHTWMHVRRIVCICMYINVY